MLDEKEILGLMEEYREETPAAAEAAYLAASGVGTEKINKNLQRRYGTGQGYAKFKKDFEETSGYAIRDGLSVELIVDEQDTTKKLERVDAEDVGTSLDIVIRNAFLEKVEETLREEIEEQILEMSKDARLFAGVARKGFDNGVWDANPSNGKLWDIFSLLTNKHLPDLQKKKIKDELVLKGCFYYRSRLTPMFCRLESPYKNLANLKPVWPED